MGIGAALFAALAITAPHHTPPAHVLRPAEQARAVTIALSYWQARDPQLMPDGLPACGEPQITWTPLDTADNEGGYAITSTCSIALNSQAFDLPWEAPLVCETILHEIGHLVLGPQHSTNPYSPMYWEIWRVVPACQEFRLPTPREPHNVATGAG